MQDKKRALIFGVGGQDGSYLRDILVGKGYAVFGVHPHVCPIPSYLDLDRLELFRADIRDVGAVIDILRESKPDYVYNVADIDKPTYGEDRPLDAYSVTAVGALNVIWATWKYSEAKLFQPSSVLMRDPAKSVYAAAKRSAHYLAHHYRRKGLKAIVGVMYNHHSLRRGSDYLLNKIVRCAKSGDWTGFDLTDGAVDIGSAKQFMNYVVEKMESSETGYHVVGTGKYVLISDLVRTACHHFNTSTPALTANPQVQESSVWLNDQLTDDAMDILRELLEAE